MFRRIAAGSYGNSWDGSSIECGGVAWPGCNCDVFDASEFIDVVSTNLNNDSLAIGLIRKSSSSLFRTIVSTASRDIAVSATSGSVQPNRRTSAATDAPSRSGICTSSNMMSKRSPDSTRSMTSLPHSHNVTW